MLLSAEGVLLDAEDLIACGWTEDLIRKFLVEEDDRMPVNHYANFRGKRLWKMGRVASVEQSEDFRDAFAVSIARRSLGPKQVRGYIEARRMARQTMTFLLARGRAVNH